MSPTSSPKNALFLGPILLAIVALLTLPTCLAAKSDNLTTAAASDDQPQPPSTPSPLDHSRALVWGPGLRPDLIVLPARYFHIHARHADDTPLTASLGQPYDIRIHGHGGGQPHQPCNVRVQQFDRGDGSVLVRYALAANTFCTAVAIHIAHSGRPVGASPYRLASDAAVVRSAECRCARRLDAWLPDNRCPAEHAQITADLRPFGGSVNVTQTRERLLQRFVANAQAARSVALCHYAVQSQRLYRRCYGEHTGFKMFADAVLVALLRQVRLPDAELFVNLGDWPLMRRGGQARTGAGPLPVFSWCGSTDSLDIVWPTYDLTESALQSMGRVQLDMQSVQAQRWPWSAKRPQAFWRGRDSRRERLQLVELARRPDVAELFNVSLTNFFFFRDEEPRFGPRAPHLSFMDFFEYRWQICVDGTVAAYRLPYLLGGDALVLRQQSPFYEHFYGQLRPWEHYVPVRRDLADLVERVRWARDNEAAVRRIVATAQQFARDQLQADHVLCYHALLLKKWSEKLVGTVRVDGMEEVEVTGNDCDCDQGDELAGQHDEL